MSVPAKTLWGGGRWLRPPPGRQRGLRERVAQRSNKLRPAAVKT